MSKQITLSNLTRFHTKIMDAINTLLAGYVAKVDGKDLSTNDLTDALKTNYDAAHTHAQSAHAPSTAQANVLESVSVNGVAQTVTNKGVNIAGPTKVSEMSDATDYLKKSERGNVYEFKGSVDNYASLPAGLGALATNDPSPVYNCRDTGKNWAWTGTEWDDLGGTISIETATDADIDAMFE